MTEEAQEQGQDQTQDQAPFPVSENPYTGAAPEVTPAGNPDVVPASPEEGVAVTMVEGEDGQVIDDTPSSIQMQPGDPTVPKPEHLSDLKKPEHLSDSQADRLKAEMDAGAHRVQEHAERQTLIDAKRESEVPEEVQVAEATEANKDL